MIETPAVVQIGESLSVSIGEGDRKDICEDSRLIIVGECTVAMCGGPESNKAYCNDEWKLIAGSCPFTKG